MAENTGKKEKGSNKKKREKKAPFINIWGIAGRHQIMEMRRLWQLRIPAHRVGKVHDD